MFSLILADSGVAVEDTESISGAHLVESNMVATDKVQTVFLLFMFGWILAFFSGD